LATVVVAAIVVCIASASIGNVLHFQMKFRLVGAGLPVKWFMMPLDDFRMWRTYMNEAHARQWPVWPFYVYRVSLVLFAISGIFVVFNIDKLSALLRSLFTH
jgi:hypothetical protein